jgi:hypothetical protein
MNHSPKDFCYDPLYKSLFKIFKLRYFRKQKKIDSAFGFYRNFTMLTQNACNSKSGWIAHTQISHGTRCSSYLSKDIKFKACLCYMRMWALHKDPTCRLIAERPFVKKSSCKICWVGRGLKKLRFEVLVCGFFGNFTFFQLQMLVTKTELDNSYSYSTWSNMPLVSI